MRARISGLPPSTREALALASALGTISVSLLERAGITLDALDPAFASQVIERKNGTIRFTHPLLASVPAREAIEPALAQFEAIGAAGWAAKARAQLGRVGGRTREQGLTAAERRVATLVAGGRTNREVAAR